MEKTILIMLIVIALLVCAIAGLIIYISGQAQKIKTAEATNKTILNSYRIVQKEKEELVTDNINLKNRLRALKVTGNSYSATPLKPKYDTGDFKAEILRDYNNGVTVNWIAKKY